MGIRISGAELEIMNFLWEHPQGCMFAELLKWSNASGKREWSKQTLNTYLLRLRKRGLVIKVDGPGKTIYRPSMTEPSYERACAEELLDDLYGGGLGNFIAALGGRKSLTKKEEKELMDFINSKLR